MIKNAVITIRVPKEFKDELQAKCDTIDMNPSDIARKLLKRWLNNKKKKSVI